jgi:hypothetical protein
MAKKIYHNKWLKIALVVFVIYVLFTALGVIGKVKEYVSEASVSNNMAEVVLSRTLQNNLMKNEIFLRTGNGGESAAVSYIGFRLSLPDGVTLTDKDGKTTDSPIIVTDEYKNSEFWQFPVNKINSIEDKVFVDFAAVNLSKEGFSAGDFVKIAEFYSRENDNQNVKFFLDSEYSFIYTKKRPVTNIWQVPEFLLQK